MLTASLRGLAALVLLLTLAAVGAATAAPPTGQGTATPVASPTPDPCGLAWRIVASPDPGDDNPLRSVAAAAPDDIWAVGGTGSMAYYQTLVVHWNGQGWSRVPSPNISSRSNSLSSVAVRSANDAWAVGGASLNTVPAQALIVHWDGQQWSLVPGPSLSAAHYLTAVAARAPDDAWAVGHSGDEALVLHWNGTRWSRVPGPQPGTFSTLEDVVVVGWNDAWAVGYYSPDSISGDRSLLLHWDGMVWSQVPAPNLTGNDNYLHGVAAHAADDIWAVGAAMTDGGEEPLLAHWNGTRWSLVPAPDLGAGYHELYDVTAPARGDAWAVGVVDTRTIIVHWDGSGWNRMPSPAAASPYNLLYGVAATEGVVWAVGAYDIPSDNGKTLTLRYTDPCATRTPTATGTPPAATPTHPATVIPTACPFQFSDVPPGSPFYDFVRCLACQGVISGYADGTCRPGFPITRGQMSKLIALAAGYVDPIPGGRQTFADVVPAHPFWLFVERAVAQGVIGGYGCGGPGEPCPGRYFRPGTPVTRGQAAKFVAGALAWADPIPTGRRSFGDVPPGDPFWLFVERAYLHEVIDGYTCDDQTINPCGGGVERCPGRYYQPCATLTRGQAAKLLAGAFFPVCRPPVRE
jgi:hypothetical protein